MSDHESGNGPREGAAGRLESGLLTDLYELTMLSAYHADGMEGTAVFELFVRKLPETRNFLIAAGLDQVLDYLEGLSFTGDELEWLESTGHFSRPFLDYLADLRFTGDVQAMPEGTVFFANEPLIRVTAPLPEAQLVESRLINIVHLQTLLASKAARSVLVAPGKALVDFGMRRAHGSEAALYAGRASYAAGFTGTATVLAGRRYGIPIFGTMAHSFVQAHDSETNAFLVFARAHPHNVVLLIDTYDTRAAAEKVVKLAPRLADEGIAVKAVRIDSGDLLAQARDVRAILDAGGCREVGIFLSGNLDEYRIEELLAAGAPADGFGIGTHLDVSTDAPYLDAVYKLQEYAGQARRKRSAGKATWPGRKQVYRRCDAEGTMTGDVIALEDEEQAGEPLLVPVMRNGRRVAPAPSLEEVRQRAREQLARLPAELRGLARDDGYPVTVSERLRALADEVDRAFP